MDSTARAMLRFLGLLAAFVGLYASVDAMLLLVLPEQLPAGMLTDRSILTLMAREMAVGCGAIGIGALLLYRTREPEPPVSLSTRTLGPR